MANKNVYGYRPECGAPGIQRERRMNGDDKCENGHTYPSRLAVPNKQGEKMSVRAKFKVDSIEMSKSGADITKTIKMSPVYKNADPNTENSKFWRWTPSGSLLMNCLNPTASEQFELGKEYYLDFTPVKND